jgi:phage-related protein
MKRKIQLYESASGNRPVEKFIRNLDKSAKAKVLATLEYIQETEKVPLKMFCRMKATDDLWEVRVKISTNIYRLLSFFDGACLVILVHGFQRKSQKTPSHEIKTAEARKKDYLLRKQL